MEAFNIVTVTPENLEDAGLFCVKDKKSGGYKAKLKWYLQAFKNGLTIKIAVNPDGRQLGFIEYIPSEYAWRPILAESYLFIHCIMVYSKADRNKDIGSTLIAICEKEANEQDKVGICAMSSKGAWMADKSLFKKNGFEIAGKLDRYELMYKPLNNDAKPPELINWYDELQKYHGWNLIYADQCPWHTKSAHDLEAVASAQGIEMNIIKLNTPQEAQFAPTGYGTFSLVKDGEILADHYISKTRFENILKKSFN